MALSIRRVFVPLVLGLLAINGVCHGKPSPSRLAPSSNEGKKPKKNATTAEEEAQILRSREVK